MLQWQIVELWNYEIKELWSGKNLKAVELRKTTDVLEYSSTLIEQRTLDARGVLIVL